MRLIDSSGWLEVFRGGPHADRVARLLADPAEVLTPTIAIYEVYKVLKRDASEEDALQAVAWMLRTNVVPLSETLALEAADASLEHALAMADAIVYTTARSRGAELVTTDADLEGLPGVVFLSKKKT
ncbi:MAG: type II toxin-antitoxin system VapC family toxin [Holophagales bacterium]|nr:type II toxin-antitoxin system VapC family toxin [Holophagales bacterium]